MFDYEFLSPSRHLAYTPGMTTCDISLTDSSGLKGNTRF